MTKAPLTNDAGDAFSDLASHLVDRAARIATQTARARQLARVDEDAPWRRAEFLWPDFPKG